MPEQLRQSRACGEGRFLVVRPAFAWVILGALLVFPSPRATAEPAAAGLSALHAQAAAVFDPGRVAGADLSHACDQVLVLGQAISVTLIVAGMIIRIRREHDQMSGIAATMLKVAFIATVPWWAELTLGTADAMAGELGYRPAAAAERSPLVGQLWSLAAQWTPADSPYLDALAAQDAANVPASGEEGDWSLRAWNWARGVGTATSGAFESQWQAISGGLRASIVLVGSGAMACLTFLVLMLVYLADVLRALLFAGGGALLPVFIAGLGIDALRQPSFRFILGWVAIACWPVGWALAQVGTATLLEGANRWMSAIAASTDAGTVGAPSVALVAPYLSWGILFLLMALTVALCLWTIAGLTLAPLLLGKVMAAGGQSMTRLAGIDAFPVRLQVPATAAESRPLPRGGRPVSGGDGARNSRESVPMGTPGSRQPGTLAGGAMRNVATAEPRSVALPPATPPRRRSGSRGFAD